MTVSATLSQSQIAALGHIGGSAGAAIAYK